MGKLSASISATLLNICSHGWSMILSQWWSFSILLSPFVLQLARSINGGSRGSSVVFISSIRLRLESLSPLSHLREVISAELLSLPSVLNLITSSNGEINGCPLVFTPLIRFGLKLLSPWLYLTEIRSAELASAATLI
jgi:hypothetical protein